jgi:hypothetical protein
VDFNLLATAAKCDDVTLLAMLMLVNSFRIERTCGGKAGIGSFQLSFRDLIGSRQMAICCTGRSGNRSGHSFVNVGNPSEDLDLFSFAAAERSKVRIKISSGFRELFWGGVPIAEEIEYHEYRNRERRLLLESGEPSAKGRP